MKHDKEKPQCYQIDMVEESVQKVIASETLSSPMDRVMVYSIKQVEDEHVLEIEKCLLQLQ